MCLYAHCFRHHLLIFDSINTEGSILSGIFLNTILFSSAVGHERTSSTENSNFLTFSCKCKILKNFSLRAPTDNIPREGDIFDLVSTVNSLSKFFSVQLMIIDTYACINLYVYVSLKINL